jgi:hypothetical protein
MSRKLSSNLGAKVDKAKKELAYDERTSDAQNKINRSRKPKNFTIAQENIEWIDKLALELSMSKGKRISTSSLVNALLDKARTENPHCENLKFIK